MEEGESSRKEAEMVLGALVGALHTLEQDIVGFTNGYANGDGEAMSAKLKEKVGPLVAERVLELGRPKLVRVILES